MDDPELGTSGLGRLRELSRKVRGGGLGWLKARLQYEISHPTLAPTKWLRDTVVKAERLTRRRREAGSGLLHCFYDLAVNPITFDFAYFLVACELAAREKRASGFILVVVPGKQEGLRQELSEYEAIVDAASRRWRLDGVVLGLAQTAIACKGVVVCPDRAFAQNVLSDAGENRFPENYSVSFPSTIDPYGYVYRRALAPGSFRGLRASPQGLTYVREWQDAHMPSGARPVTITLRQYKYWPNRNNSLPDWAAFARRIAGEGYWPVIVPDTDEAVRPIPPELREFTAFPEAAWYLPLRMALYENAYMNFFVNNGPMHLCHLNPASAYMMFKVMVPGCPVADMEFFTKRGDRIGESPLFATGRQRWIWRDDEAEILYAEFSALSEQIDSKVSAPGT